MEKKNRLQKRLQAICDFLTGQKAFEPYVHIFEDANPVADAMLAVSAGSGRHARGLADGLLRFCQENDENYLRMEGYEGGLWILVDLNDLIVHIFQAESRALYRLEDLCEQARASKKEIV